MKDKLIVRSAWPEEFGAISKLTFSAYLQYAMIMQPEAWTALQHNIRGALDASSNARRFVAELESKVAGSVMLFPPAKDHYGDGGRMIWPEVRLLAVDPDFRGQGVGTALLKACFATAREQGFEGIGLYSSASMRSALLLYARLGFEPVSRYDFQRPGSELIQAYYRSLV